MKKIQVLLLALAVFAVAARRHEKHDDNGNGHHGGHQKKLHDHDDDDHYDDDYDALQKRLDLVTSRLHEIDDDLDKRMDEGLRKKALSLDYRVSVLEDANCDEDHYDCGVPDHECVSRLLVCDGENDCRNGDDEKHCDLPTKKGDHFEGEQVFMNCSENIPEHFDFTITAVKTHKDYPSFPIIQATLHFTDEDHDSEDEVVLPTYGYYRYATHKLVLKPPQGRGLAFVCDFDGHNDDRCVAEVKSAASGNVCGEYVFHRHDEDDDHDDDHHDDDHHDDDHHDHDDDDDHKKGGHHKKHGKKTSLKSLTG